VTVSTETMSAERIVAAVKAGENAASAMVSAVPNLTGAKVSGCCVDAYVIASDSGFSVECWRRAARDPYKVVSLESLHDAVRLALSEL